jgi:uncharacterized membrane protein YdjX (TVP38/TMEM64 family)
VSSTLRIVRAVPSGLLIAGAIFALVAIGGVVGSRAWGNDAVAMAQSIVEFLRSSGFAGPAYFVAVQVLIALTGAVPVSMLAVAAGAVYGLILGFALAALGTLLGAVIGFGLSRRLFRSAIERLVSRHGRLRKLDASISQDGWKLVCLLRLSPVMPFSATTYLLGLSTVSLPDYLAGTLACLPVLLGYACLGALTDAGVTAWASGNNPLRWILLGVGGIATLLVVVHLRRLASRQQPSLQLIDQGFGSSE